jgi:hypothetical protein
LPHHRIATSSSSTTSSVRSILPQTFTPRRLDLGPIIEENGR